MSNDKIPHDHPIHHPIEYVKGLLTAKGEGGTEYDGAFSHPGEFHAFAIGVTLAMGATSPEGFLNVWSALAAALGGNYERLNLRGVNLHEVKRETWYCALGLAVGGLVRFGPERALALF